jgi:ATP-binding cassette subfamily G (WHITE) protein 2 (SNQ2)
VRLFSSPCFPASPADVCVRLLPFHRSIFFILLFNALLGMTEVTTSFSGRAILAKHKSFALYRPAAVVLAQVLADFPILIGQVTAFLLPIYWMSGLKHTASAFFTLWIITYVTTLALLGFFRAIGFSFSSFDGASQVSGLAVGLLILYTGFVFVLSCFSRPLCENRA